MHSYQGFRDLRNLCGASSTLPRCSKIHAIVWFIMAGYPFISSHPLPTLLEWGLLFLKNCRQKPYKVRRSVDYWLSAFLPHCLATLGSSEHRNALPRRNRASLEMHLDDVIERVGRYAVWGHVSADLKAVMERVWRCTWRPWWSEFGHALEGHDQTRLEAVMEVVILEAVVLERGTTGA